MRSAAPLEALTGACLALTLALSGAAWAAAEPAPQAGSKNSAAGQGASPLVKTGPAKEYLSFEIDGIDGGKIATSDLKGNLVVVDVWGTWCGPCRSVIPHLVSLQKDYGPRGLVVVGISAEMGGDLGTVVKRVKDFAAEMGINYRLGILDEKVYGDIKRLMRFEGESFTVPTTLVLDRDGSILARYPGYFFGQEKEIAELIRQHIGGNQKSSGGMP